MGRPSKRPPHSNQATPRTRGGRRTLETLNSFPQASAERQDLVDELRVREDHPAAAVAREAEVVEGLLRRLPRAGPLEERRVRARDDLPAREASDGDDHGLTGTTSAASSALRGPGGSSGASAACPAR